MFRAARRRQASLSIIAKASAPIGISPSARPTDRASAGIRRPAERPTPPRSGCDCHSRQGLDSAITMAGIGQPFFTIMWRRREPRRCGRIAGCRAFPPTPGTCARLFVGRRQFPPHPHSMARRRANAAGADDGRSPATARHRQTAILSRTVRVRTKATPSQSSPRSWLSRTICSMKTCLCLSSRLANSGSAASATLR